ncbi:hypothetical protein J1605_008326 [Eschrichtius robustus]|uniref:Secreted protein n=1 Tax=Eschrichtius robustus TaxID=9764 RepID=A0AB34GY05_ESCRO|nr:hypothetical protein J1605_008326 [Eschrichtius robustus]
MYWVGDACYALLQMMMVWTPDCLVIAGLVNIQVFVSSAVHHGFHLTSLDAGDIVDIPGVDFLRLRSQPDAQMWCLIPLACSSKTHCKF